MRIHPDALDMELCFGQQVAEEQRRPRKQVMVSVPCTEVLLRSPVVNRYAQHQPPVRYQRVVERTSGRKKVRFVKTAASS